MLHFEQNWTRHQLILAIIVIGGKKMKHHIKSAWERYANYKTERQWNKQGYMITNFDLGEELWPNYYCEHLTLYYPPDGVKEMTLQEREEYHQMILEQRRNAYRRHKAREEQRRQKEKERQRIDNSQTSWQWLSHDRRKIIEGSEPVKRTGRYDNGYKYYPLDCTTPVTPEEYGKLKTLYINKYGGWLKIDLEHTDYDGSPWY